MSTDADHLISSNHDQQVDKMHQMTSAMTSRKMQQIANALSSSVLNNSNLKIDLDSRVWISDLSILQKIYPAD